MIVSLSKIYSGTSGRRGAKEEVTATSDSVVESSVLAVTSQAGDTTSEASTTMENRGVE
jgi:hypothetical protein